MLSTSFLDAETQRGKNAASKGGCPKGTRPKRLLYRVPFRV
jgi:hypothetical protein